MSKEFTITFCGDTSLGYYYLENNKNKYPEAYQRLKNDPMSFFSGVAPLLEGSNEVIVNLETVLSTNPGNPIEGKQYPGFDDPDVTVDVLKKLGVTAVMLANNHSMDYGPETMLEMSKALEENNISVIGAGKNILEARKPYKISAIKSGLPYNIYILNGMRSSRRYQEYGFFATKNSPGIANTNRKAVALEIAKCKKYDPGCLVIVSPHWQGIDYKHVADKHREWSRDMIDAGADYVIAHGTHKADEVEVYKGAKIFYSIGNFVFNSPGRYRREKVSDKSLVVSISLTRGNESVKSNFITSDNKKTNFFVHGDSGGQDLLENFYGNGRETSAVSSVVGSTRTINEWLKNMPGLEYVYHGNEWAKCDGFDCRFRKHNRSCFFIIMDDNWAEGYRVKHRQYDRNIDEIIKEAKDNLFSGFVVNESRYDKTYFEKENVIVVDDSKKFLMHAAEFSKNNTRAITVAVTGSAGKSTTQKLISHVLKETQPSARVLSPSKNQNLSINILMHLTKLSGYDYSVLEVSASKFYKNNAFSIAPNVAVFTTLSEGHLDSYGTMREVAEIKATIFDLMDEKSTAVINTDMPYFDLVLNQAKKQKCNILLYGEREDSQIRLVDYNFRTGQVVVDFLGELINYDMGMLGKHLVMNSMAVLGVIHALGDDWRKAAKTIGSFSPIKGRGKIIKRKVKNKEITIIDESYNANPASMRAALEMLKNYIPKGEGRRIAVLGDMLELGENSSSIHLDLLSYIFDSNADKVYLVGDVIQVLWDEIPHGIRASSLPAIKTLANLLEEDVVPGDVVLFKASNKIALSEVVKSIK